MQSDAVQDQITAVRDNSVPLSTNKHLLRWVDKMAELTRPAKIHWVDGSKEEYDRLCAEMVAGGTLVKLNEKLWPACFYARSDSSDVARVADPTFICPYANDNAAPTHTWEKPHSRRKSLR